MSEWGAAEQEEAIIGLEEGDELRLLLRIPIRGCSAFSRETETERARSAVW
jgi:hypothetical protein